MGSGPADPGEVASATGRPIPMAAADAPTRHLIGKVGRVASERQVEQSEDSDHTEVVGEGGSGRDVEMVMEGDRYVSQVRWWVS